MREWELQGLKTRAVKGEFEKYQHGPMEYMEEQLFEELEAGLPLNLWLDAIGKLIQIQELKQKRQDACRNCSNCGNK